jgi:hypothetical protein
MKKRCKLISYSALSKTKFFKYILSYGENMKTNGSFRLSKQSKIHLSNILNTHTRGIIRKAFIEAEVMQHIQPRVAKQQREKEAE